MADAPMILKAWSLKVPEIDDLVKSYDAACTRAEAAEARAADEELRAKSWHDSAMTLADQRDEARRQLSEAQRAIDVLSNTVVAQDAEIKRLSQAREDVTEYRARVNELFEACKAARDWFDRNTKQGHTPGPVEKMLIDAIQAGAVTA